VRRVLLAAAAVLVAGLPRVALHAKEAPAPLAVSILSPRGGQTRERVVTIRGTVSGFTGERVTLVLNGVAMSVPRSGDGFSSPQVLAPGSNAIRAVVEEGGRTASDDVAVFARVPAKDLRVTLTWDTPATDVDLWVTGPDGEKVFYQQRQGKQGGTLDTDVTTGFGPETFTQARATPGTYRVQAHYYGGAAPTRVRVTVVRGEGTPQEERTELGGVLLRPQEVLEVGEFVVAR
jgi:uncharacterized protein YfaP (DUF2135 family)